MQLSLFTEIERYPYAGKLSSKQRQLITEVFGAEAIEGIGLFIGDILDLYPYKTYCRDSGDFSYLVIGCSCRQQTYFYMLDEETKSIYLIHNFSLFPDLKKKTA